MSLQVASIDLSAAQVGTTGTVDWNTYLPVASESDAPGRRAVLRLYNESGCGLSCLFNQSHKAVAVPAGNWPTIQVGASDTALTYTVSYILPNAPVAKLTAILFLPGESVDDTGPLGNSPIGITGNVATNNIQTLTNDNQPPATQIIESTPNDQLSSSFALKNDGSGFWQILSANALRKIVNAVRGNASSTHAVVDIGDTGDLNMTTFHGLFDAGCVFPAAQVGAGALNSLTTIPGSQVSSAVSHATTCDSTVASSAHLVSDDATEYVIVHKGTVNSNAYIGLEPAGGENTFGHVLFYVDSGGVQRAGLQVKPDGSGQMGANALGMSYDASGNLTANSIASLGGQASAGSFGAPVIVAQALRVNVAVTTLTNILVYSVTTTGYYRLSPYVFVNNGTSPTKITLNVLWTDPDKGSSLFYRFISSNSIASAGTDVPVVADGATAIFGNNPFLFAPYLVYAKTGTSITCSFADSAGTPNDFVTCIIERMA